MAFLQELEIKNRKGLHARAAAAFVKVAESFNADILVENMKQEGILIKSYDGIGKFGKCLRVTTGEKKYMKMFLDALQKLDKE